MHIIIMNSVNKVCIWILNYLPKNKFKTELFHWKRNWDTYNCKNIIFVWGEKEKVPANHKFFWMFQITVQSIAFNWYPDNSDLRLFRMKFLLKQYKPIFVHIVFLSDHTPNETLHI